MKRLFLLAIAVLIVIGFGKIKKMEIFIGNLPFDLTKQELIECFEKFGELGVVRMMFDAQARFRGIAYVEFVGDDCARKAIAEMNEQEIKGRKMKVDYARPLRPRFNGFGGAFGRNEKKCVFKRRFEESEISDKPRNTKNLPKYIAKPRSAK